MLKKTLSALGIAVALVLGGSSAAFAAYPPEAGVEAGDTTITVSGTTVITVSGADEEDEATFAVTAGPAGATIASIVKAASVPSVTKQVVDGSASATFNPAAAGSHTVTVTGGSGAVLGSVTISVAADGAATGGTGGTGGASGSLPATGSTVPTAAIWLGVGALGLGGIAVAAGMARRRASVKR